MGRRFVPFLVFCLFACMSLLQAQRQHPLGKDAGDMEERLSAYMLSDPNLKKETKELLTVWTSEYLSYFSTLSEAHREHIAEIARSAHKAHVQPYPELYHFFNTQKKLLEQNPSAFSPWLKALQKVLKKNQPRRFNTLVSRTYDVLSFSQLYKSNAAYWRFEVSSGAPAYSDVFSFEEKDEPVFVFSNINLICSDGQDSIAVVKTSGLFYPFSDKFEGRQGRAYWQRVGLDPDSCYTELGAYVINLKQARYEADNVVHHNLYLYPKPLRGHFSERIVTGNPLIKERYPEFRSNEVLYFTNMFPEVDVQGALVQEGIRNSFGSDKLTSRMTLREGNYIRAVVTSGRFMAEKGRISATDARVVMYLKEDSLYNNSVTVRYDAAKRNLHAMLPLNSGLTVPFIDTYHRLRMDFESMRWYQDKHTVEMGLLEMPGRVGVVSFKSLDIFSRDELGRMSQGMDDNPLYLLAVLSKTVGDKTLFMDEVADMLRVSTTQALAMLRTLITYGYVAYDPIKKKVRLLPQLFHILDVTSGKADFDEIEFRTTEDNIVKAVMRLDSLDITIKDVPYVLMSGKQNVYAEPYDSTVHVFRNVDFHFDGLFHAGKFNFAARGARFYYDEFKVDIADVKEMGLEVTRFEGGEEIKRPVESVIKALTGTVYIDDPRNKGGRKNYPQYPIFESTQPSYVYYDAPRIQNGAYVADSFYFRVDPFKMEKLHTVDMDSIRFKGTLLSFGIFPDIPEYLVVRPDLSLGFATQSPAGGWPSYRGQSKYEGDLFLDNSGLYGKGSFSYLGAMAVSNRMVFLPKRMYGRSKSVRQSDTVIGGRTYPYMRATEVDMEYLRNRNELSLRSRKDSLMHFYTENWLLSGTYTVSHTSSKASGELKNQNRYFLSSRGFTLERRSVSADTAGFKMASGSLAMLETEGMKCSMNLDTRRATFSSWTLHSPLGFGANHYDGYASSLDWDMEKNLVRMKHGLTPSAALLAYLDSIPRGELYSADLPGERFKSSRRAQAGLNFYATSSLFSYKDTLLRFEGVKRLLTADAMLVPAMERLVIDKGGQVIPLSGAELYFGDWKRPHSFHNVSAQVLSAEQYRASGLFDYKAPDMEVQPIRFTGIRPLGDGYSQASTRITFDSGVLALNEAFQFIGKIELSALETYPFFAGSVRMNYSCHVSEDNPAGEDVPEQEPVEDFAYTPTYEQWDYQQQDDDTEAEEEGDDAQAETVADDLAVSYDDFDYQEENEIEKAVEEDELDNPSARRGRKKNEDEARPAEEVLGLGLDNPFLVDGIQFRAYINSDSVCIPIDENTRSTVGRLLGCGFYTQFRSRQIQFRFMERKITTDIPNLAVTGALQFSPREKAYKVIDSSGIERFALSLNSCQGKAYGEIEPAFNTYELNMKFFGDMLRSGQTGTVSTKAMGMFDFYLAEEVQKRLASLFNKHMQATYPDRELNENVEGILRENLPPKELEKALSDAARLGVLNRIPDFLKQSLVFSDLELEWDENRKAFFSLPDATAEVLAVGGTPVNKRYKAMVGLRKTRKGDVVDIYLEATSSLWFYFSYTNHYMQIITSDEDFNEYLKTLKNSVRKKGRYEYFLATLSKRNTFVGSFKAMQE